MKKALLIILILTSALKNTFAQDFQYGAVTNDELDMKTYPKDTSAHAVVLQEFGKTTMITANDDYYKLRFEYHIKIKILDDKGFDKGSVEIPAYFDDDTYESVDDIEGATYYKDESGAIQSTELEKKKIYSEKTSKHVRTYKFAMPGLKKGCILEYKYAIESPYTSALHAWEFQSDIPKIYSEYEVHIPAFWVYNASIKGYLKLSKSTGVVEPKCFSSGHARCDCSLLVNAMTNIPAFKDEDYMTSPKNFKSTINYELVEFTNPSSGEKKVVTKEWKDIDKRLLESSYFGGQIKRKGVFKERIVPVIAGTNNDLEKAKAVYSYIQKLLKWNGRLDAESIDGISKAVDAKGGNSGDINLALVAALKTAGLNASAVLLSTRDNGAINTLYPVINDFNYVVARVDIGDQNYLLDATDPLLPFGMLPLKCLNDKGRVFSFDKPSFFMDLVGLPQKEKTTRAYDFTLQDDNKIKGFMVIYHNGYDAYEKRKAIKKFNSTDEYVEDIASKQPKLKILKAEISNVDSLELPLIEKFEVEISPFDKEVADKFTFNPFFMDKISNNPFKLAERSFPVDWGMASESRYVLTMHLPSQYEIEKPPQAISIGLPNNGGKFLSTYEPLNNTFTFSNIIQFNKSIYSPEEYPYLKEIYNKIVLAEKAEMVFKKKQ